MKTNDIIKFALFLIIVILAGWAVHHFHLFRKLTHLRGWIQENGLYGAIIYMLAFGAAFSFGVPAIALTVYAGTCFGTFTGLAVSSMGATIGIILTFCLSRYLARDLVNDALGDKHLFIRIDELTEKYGWYMVAIIRFIPFIPAEITNYGFGLTKIKFGPYILTSFLTMLPWLFIYIAGTDAYMDYKVDKEIPWVLVVPSVIMLGLLVFAAYRFMKLIEPELQKRKK
jgi:uncharacterized membrane protein YdjX (TVP38/TMEM64 family)